MQMEELEEAETMLAKKEVILGDRDFITTTDLTRERINLVEEATLKNLEDSLLGSSTRSRGADWRPARDKEHGK